VSLSRSFLHSITQATEHKAEADMCVKSINTVACVCEALQSDKHVIVHCVAGRSRSCAVVVGALMRARDMSLCEAYDLVKTRRPSTQIHPAFSALLGMVKP